MISCKMMRKILWGNFEKSFLEQEKMASGKVFRHFLHANFFMYIHFFPFNQELICTCEFLKKLKLHSPGRGSSRNFSFLKNSLRQINSKLNSKLYDCLYTKNSLTHWLLHQTVHDPLHISWRFFEIFQNEGKHKNKPYAQ